MPSKKKKFNARFPPARIKKIMQSDEDVGKVATAVPVMLSRALEIFMENLLLKTSQIAEKKGARTLSSWHLKQVIMEDSRLKSFLQELASKVPDPTQDSGRTPGGRMSGPSSGLTFGPVFLPGPSSSPGYPSPSAGFFGAGPSMMSNGITHHSSTTSFSHHHVPTAGPSTGRRPSSTSTVSANGAKEQLDPNANPTLQEPKKRRGRPPKAKQKAVDHRVDVDEDLEDDDDNRLSIVMDLQEPSASSSTSSPARRGVSFQLPS